MAIKRDKIVIAAGAVVYKKERGKDKWLLVREEENSDWDIPKATARRVESSVRAAIRTIQEMAGMNAKVLAEAGRAGGSTLVNNKTIPIRRLYYLMRYEDSAGEGLGYHEIKWFEYAAAVRKLKQKRDRAMIKGAREELRAYRKALKAKKKKK